jgi:hypothetical protein
MRREGYLTERIADPDNLRLAFWKACRGKNHDPEVEAYRARLDDHLTSPLSRICNSARNISGFAIRKSIPESKYDPPDNLNGGQPGEAIPSQAIANCLVFRAALQMPLNGIGEKKVSRYGKPMIDQYRKGKTDEKENHHQEENQS